MKKIYAFCLFALCFAIFYAKASEIAELNATVEFSKTTPNSGEFFYLDIRTNSASLGGLSGFIEDMRIEFDLPEKLKVVASPKPYANDFYVVINGTHVELNWNNIVPMGAPYQVRFTLMWEPGVTLEGVDKWSAPEIYVNATNCIGNMALNFDGNAVPDITPTNTASIQHLTAKTQDVYAAFLHIATINLSSESSSGGLNLHNGIIEIDFDDQAYIAAAKLNGAVIPFTVNPPAFGRKTVVFILPDSIFNVYGPWGLTNALQLMYSYPPATVVGVPKLYDMNITFTAVRENGDPINETTVIHEEIEYIILPGDPADLFDKSAPEKFVRVTANPLNWLLTFTPFTHVQNIELIDDPALNEADFFTAFRLQGVSVSAYDSFLDLPEGGRTRTKIFYERSDEVGLNIWHAATNTEITAPGYDQYSWGVSELTSSALGIAPHYVTRVKFEFYDTDGISKSITEQAGQVQIRLYALATAAIMDEITSNSYNDDDTITNTITAKGMLQFVPFDETDVTKTTRTELNANSPILYWSYQPKNWYYYNGGTPDWNWADDSPAGEWNNLNSAGGGTGFVRIGDEVWVKDQWILEGGYFHDPICYFYVPDPNIEILGVGTGTSLRCTDVEYFDAPGGGHIIKFRVKNTVTGIPGNPQVTFPTSGWDSYLPAFGGGDPGGYGYSWGHWWARQANIALKIKFKQGAQNSSVSGDISFTIISGDPEQVNGRSPWGGGYFGPLGSSNILVQAGAATAGQPFLAGRGFGYIIDNTVGLLPLSSSSENDISYTGDSEELEIDNSLSDVDVYFKMKIENSTAAGYGDIIKFRMIETFPFFGDVMTINNVPKLSTDPLTDYQIYSVKLNGIELLPFTNLKNDSIKVYYSATTNYVGNRYAVVDVNRGLTGDWIECTNGLIPSGINNIMFQKDTLFIGETFEVVFRATALEDTKTNKYNHSFAVGGCYKNSSNNIVNIVPGQPNKGMIIGLGENTIKISGNVWNDENRNGMIDIGELGYHGVEMILYNDKNEVVSITHTDINGDYFFSGDFDANTAWHIELTLPNDYELVMTYTGVDNVFFKYLSIPSYYFTFGATPTDILYLNAGIYDNRNPIEIDLNIKLFLEGVVKIDAVPGAKPYMTTWLQGPTEYWFLPSQLLPVRADVAYPDPPGREEYYHQINDHTGTAGAVVDWILIEIWGNFESSFIFTGYDLIESRALLLQPDGSVVDTNGNIPKFLSHSMGQVRIHAKHRNHLDVLSKLVSFDSDMTYNFTDDVNKAISPMGAIFPGQVMRFGVACLWAGDLNQDFLIEGDDNQNFYDAVKKNKQNIYTFEDVNMDASVDARDGDYILNNVKRAIISPAFFYKKR